MRFAKKSTVIMELVERIYKAFTYQPGNKICRNGLLVAVIVFLLGVFPVIALAQDHALTLYAGQLTKEKFERAFSTDAEFSDATIVVVSGSWTFSSFFDGNLTLELEAQIGKYFGEQDHWEFNLPILGIRWHSFPWDSHLATSIAWGIGPSYATEVPPIELETNDSSNNWLIYWFAEITLGPPTANWEFLMRLHHRSDGFGLVADDGGSNAFCAGIRYLF